MFVLAVVLGARSRFFSLWQCCCYCRLRARWTLLQSVHCLTNVSRCVSPIMILLVRSVAPVLVRCNAMNTRSPHTAPRTTAGTGASIATKALHVIDALASAPGCEAVRKQLSDHCDVLLELLDETSECGGAAAAAVVAIVARSRPPIVQPSR